MADLAYREVYTMNPTEARKRIVHTYQQLGSISATARLWHTSRQVVRQWVSRYQTEGERGPTDRSRRPRRSPRQTPPPPEQMVLAARRETGFGRRRLALYRHILRRHGLRPQRRQRRRVYPALWAWEAQKPSAFSRRM